MYVAFSGDIMDGCIINNACQIKETKEDSSLHKKRLHDSTAAAAKWSVWIIKMGGCTHSKGFKRRIGSSFTVI